MWRPAAEQSAAESAAAESMERRAGTKGNASQQSTCRAQSRISVSQAPDRMRQLLAVWTRGGSRMRESRTYGSVRGACDETHVPTATAVRFVSYEPAIAPLGPVDIDKANCLPDWIICGGDSGGGARVMVPGWGRPPRHQCPALGTCAFPGAMGHPAGPTRSGGG